MTDAAPRCLLVAHTFPPLLGGSSNVYAALAEHAGGAIAVLTSRLDAASGREQPGWRTLDAGARHKVHRLGLVRPPLPGGAARNKLVRHLIWCARAAALTAAIAFLVRRYSLATVCVCDDDVVGWLVPLVRRVLRRRVLVYCHGDDLVQTDPRVVRQRARYLAHAQTVIAASAFAASRLAGPYGVPPQRIATIPNGVDLSRFRPQLPSRVLQERFGLVGHRVILAPTRLVPRKGVDRLIEALPSIRAAHPDAVLLVAGDGPQLPALQVLAQDVGCADAVRFAGAVPPPVMPDYYALADLVALPNRAEPGESDGMPLVFLEANACGIPVIGGRAGGTPEAVQDGMNGLLVDGNDPAAIATAAIRILGDADLAGRMRQAALAAAQGASWASRTEAFLALCS